MNYLRARFFAALASLFLLVIVSCSAGDEEATAPREESPETVIVGLALGDRGIGDLGFNDMQYNGLVEISRRYPVEISYGIPDSWQGAAVQSVLEDLVSQGANPIFTGANAIGDSIREFALSHPDITFIVLDFDQPLAGNVISVQFVQEEAAFLAGYLASRMTDRGAIGFIGGVDIPPVELFESGFINGVLFGDSTVEIRREYLSLQPDFSGFDSPREARDLAVEWLSNGGVDIIFAAAGGSGLGIIEAIRAGTQGYFIGVDADQDYLAEGKILTSVMKRLDQAMIFLMGEHIEGRLEGGRVLKLGLAEGGVSLSDFTFTRQLIGESLITEIRELEGRIIDGEINVLERPAK